VPKAAKDVLLMTTTTAKPSPLPDSAPVWDVKISPFTEYEPGDPYVHTGFGIAQFEDGNLAIIGWAITGSSDVRLSASSRFPLRTHARAALLAVEDAIEDAGTMGLSYEQVVATRHQFINNFVLEGGRLTDPRTHKVRAAPKRRYAHPANGSHRPELDDVVSEYRDAIERGSRSPTVDVARAFGVSRATAARSLAEARSQGLLGLALKARAGEERKPPT
jgi:hypothetical protein